ncbi:MAG: hypothetical protein SWH54_08125 [Thermodesulfobacteriota bacterium]|nr:hypothetical protein [Thermodesulfobacteriota bacterium]
MKKSSMTIFVICLVLGLSAQGYAINGPLIDGQGTRIMGMGATNIAVTDDSNTIANNPGAIFAHDEGVIDLDIGLVAPHPDFKNALNDEDGQNLLCPLLAVSFLSTPLNEKFKLGFGLFPMGGLASEYRLTNANYGDQVTSQTYLF